MKPTKLHMDSVLLHGGQVPDPITGARAVQIYQIYQTTNYQFHDTDHDGDIVADIEQTLEKSA